MTGENERVCCLVRHALLLQGVHSQVAGPIVEQVLAQLDQCDQVEQLYVITIPDGNGGGQDFVTRVAPANASCATPIRVAELRAMARHQLAAERDLDARLNNGGTEI